MYLYDNKKCPRDKELTFTCWNEYALVFAGLLPWITLELPWQVLSTIVIAGASINAHNVSNKMSLDLYTNFSTTHEHINQWHQYCMSTNWRRTGIIIIILVLIVKQSIGTESKIPTSSPCRRKLQSLRYTLMVSGWCDTSLHKKCVASNCVVKPQTWCRSKVSFFQRLS